MALYPPAYKTAVAMQRVAAETLKEAGCTATAKAKLIHAFVELEMLKLRLRMKPAPKPIDVSKTKKSERPSITLE